jgi:hypothetical protein
MKEYMFLDEEFSWKNSQKKFEDDLNTHAKQGWRVINVILRENSLLAILERDKNR